jgi:hypothetical protein
MGQPARDPTYKLLQSLGRAALGCLRTIDHFEILRLSSNSAGQDGHPPTKLILKLVGLADDFELLPSQTQPVFFNYLCNLF